MSITADDILKKQFTKRFFRSGYDMDGVDGFLDEVAERIHQLIEENNTLQQQTSDLQASNAKHEEQEATFKNALLSAQKVADDLVAQSKKEADGLLNDAREKVAEAQNEAEKEISRLKEEVDSLRNLRDTMRSELNDTLETFQQTLDNISKASPSYHFLDNPGEEEAAEEDTVEISLEEEADTVESISEEDNSDLFEKIDLGDQSIDTFEDMTFEAEEPVLDQADVEEEQEPDVFADLEEGEEEDKGPDLY